MPADRFSLPFGAEGVVSAQAADRLLTLKDADAALVYMAVAKNAGVCDAHALSDLLMMPRERVVRALDALKTAGLVAACGLPPEPADELPKYSAKEIAKSIGGDPGFRYLADETQRRMGKVLSQSDLSTLMGIYERMGMPVEVACMLVTHCVKETERRFGPGRKPTMRQIEREAYRWETMALMSEKEAERYLAGQEQRHTAYHQVLRALQILGRAPSASEEKYINDWLDMGFDPEAVYRAYDITVVNTGALKWKYMDSILRSWHDKELHTLEQIDRGDRPAARSQRDKAPSRHQPGEHEKRALEWLKGYEPAKK